MVCIPFSTSRPFTVATAFSVAVDSAEGGVTSKLN